MRLVWALALAACGSKDSLVSAEMKQRLEQAWQGTWVLPSYEALEIRGRTATLFYNEHVDKGTFELEAPCLARLRFRDYAFPIRFAHDGDKLLVNAVGVRAGDTWYACTEELIALHSPKACRVLGARKSSCTLTASHLVLDFYRGGDRHVELAIHGNVLWAERPPTEPYRATSFDDAKVHSRERNLDPGELSGEVVANRRGCLSCHSTDGSPKIGPSFKDVWRTTVELADGTQVLYDRHYVRESVRAPTAKARPGYPHTCIAYDEVKLTDAELDRLITYMKTLSVAR